MPMMVLMAVAFILCVLRNCVCRVESSDSKQYFQWCITPRGVPGEMLIIA